MEDFKCCSIASLLVLLEDKEINHSIFFEILCKKVKNDGLTNNQYTFLLDILADVIKIRCKIADRNIASR